MKLLGIRVCEHDTNFCYYDDGKVMYHKTERKYGVKHHALDNLWEWKFEIYNTFGIEANELDAIAIVLDPWRYNIEDCLEGAYKEISYLDVNCPVYWVNHHLAHSLSYNSLLDKPSDVSIVIDGFGDKDVAWSIYKDYELIDCGSVGQDGSIGLQYNMVGDTLNIDGSIYDIAGKLMGLQSFGNLDISFYDKMQGNTLLDITSHDAWIKHNTSIHVARNRLLDWSKTVHELMCDYVFNLFCKYAKDTDQISYVGGVAQNVCWNSVLKQKFKNLKVFPHCADDGLSIGALQFLVDKFECPQFELIGYPYCQSDYYMEQFNEETIDKIVDQLVQGKIVGVYQGNGEIGPRALGNRSILMNPAIERGKNYINERVKNREGYRPFGATILKEHTKDYFINDFDNPYMLYTDQFNIVDHPFHSVSHIDNTCRTQTLGDENPTYRKIIEKFYEKTSIPMLLNTSLNRGGKPICGTPQDAFGVFADTRLDSLFVGNICYEKTK